MHFYLLFRSQKVMKILLNENSLSDTLVFAIYIISKKKIKWSAFKNEMAYLFVIQVMNC